MQCPVCNKPIDGEFKFCPHCGSKSSNNCSGCGKNMMPDWVACPYCGLGAKMPAPPSYPPQHIPYPTSPHRHSDYHSDSSGQHRKRKKGLLGNFFSS